MALTIKVNTTKKEEELKEARRKIIIISLHVALLRVKVALKVYRNSRPIENHQYLVNSGITVPLGRIDLVG